MNAYFASQLCRRNGFSDLAILESDEDRMVLNQFDFHIPEDDLYKVYPAWINGRMKSSGSFKNIWKKSSANSETSHWLQNKYNSSTHFCNLNSSKYYDDMVITNDDEDDGNLDEADLMFDGCCSEPWTASSSSPSLSFNNEEFCPYLLYNGDRFKLETDLDACDNTLPFAKSDRRNNVLDTSCNRTTMHAALCEFDTTSAPTVSLDPTPLPSQTSTPTTTPTPVPTI